MAADHSAIMYLRLDIDVCGFRQNCRTDAHAAGKLNSVSLSDARF